MSPSSTTPINRGQGMKKLAFLVGGVFVGAAIYELAEMVVLLYFAGAEIL